ncbi:MAG: Universal stress protein UspA-like nucleotide-binding protein [Acidobacteria bacterium OLB17]|nr:MAG: Universal stress protein UspA-like nucleotide-binding protein [Acidobacteria bacterium OLB17]MCZ2389571.1 universal stress protein [Acidobacteriota bacterium]
MKIILATDGTKHGEAAAAAVKKFALSGADSIHIVTVVDMAVPLGIDVYSGYLPDTTEIEKAARDHADKVIASTTAMLKAEFEKDPPAISSDILFGSPDSRIVETAEELKADMIVLGSHGYNRWERLLLGSVSDSVVHHAHCSVLIVRSED